MTRLRVLDLFCGEGGASAGYHRAGWDVLGVDVDAARLARYPFDNTQSDALAYVRRHGHRFDLIHASPVCWGYSIATSAVADRESRYPAQIAEVRQALIEVGVPYVIENVVGARSELREPHLLCGRQFGLETIDDDGTPLVLDRHRLFEVSVPIMALEHPKHDRTLQVAGSHAGERRDKIEARQVRRGGYVPSVEVQRRLLGVPWMSERGAQLSIPPAYTEFLGSQILSQSLRGVA